MIEMVTVPIINGEYAGSISSTRADAVAGGFGVRRLTPTECERLQGFPGGHTAWGIDDNGDRVEISDSARYRMLGNAVCLKVAEWLGKRIKAVEARA